MVAVRSCVVRMARWLESPFGSPGLPGLPGCQESAVGHFLPLSSQSCQPDAETQLCQTLSAQPGNKTLVSSGQTSRSSVLLLCQSPQVQIIKKNCVFFRSRI